MRNIITQHYTIEHSELFSITSPINSNYANDIGFEFISDNTRRCPDRQIWWEKIAWLRELLGNIEDDSLVLYEDCDSINISGDPRLALHSGLEYGMVQMRGGLGCEEVVNWYNAGVIIMRNTKTVRAFLERVWNRNDNTDERSINLELKSQNYRIGDSKLICSLGVEWNCWDNNSHICSDIKIKSWHGVNYITKIDLIKRYLLNDK